MGQLEEYIERIKDRDEEAFALFYHETKAGVYAMIRSIIKDKMLAEDIMQEVYMNIVRSIHTFDNNRSAKNWVLTIAKNAAISEYRKQREIVVDQEILDVSKQHSSTTKSLYIEGLLGILDEEERQIVMLRVVDGMKHREIASLLDKPLGTVLWLYQKAIKKMKKETEG